MTESTMSANSQEQPIHAVELNDDELDQAAGGLFWGRYSAFRIPVFRQEMPEEEEEPQSVRRRIGSRWAFSFFG